MADVLKAVLLRHGESVWNREDRFTGWTDVDLSEAGVEEANKAAELLCGNSFVFDIAYTSVLKRAIHTLWTVLDRMDLAWIPVVRDWRLNERHYGALQGLNKEETARREGKELVKKWRRSYDVAPPPISRDDHRFPGSDPRYRLLDPHMLPLTESLKDTMARVLPLWTDVIATDIKSGKRVLVSAHGNSLRALVKYLDGISDEEVVELNIPTGVPLVYEFSPDLDVRKRYYLADS